MRYGVLLLLLLVPGCGLKSSTSQDDDAADNEVGAPTDAGSSSGESVSPTAETEQEAVIFLESRGGKCTRDASGNVFAVVLEQSTITDDELSHLANIRALKELSLYRTPVTDDGVPHLKVLSSLTVLNIEYTRISQDAVDELRTALPNCQVVR